MKYMVRWRQEGDTTIEAKDEEDAKDRVIEILGGLDAGCVFDHTTNWEHPELFSCEEVV